MEQGSTARTPTKDVLVLPLVAGGIAGAIFAVLYLFAHLRSVVIFYSDFIPVHTVMEAFTISVSVAISVVTWLSFRRTGITTTLLFSGTFLSVAILHTAHTLTYPGMPGDLGSGGTQRELYLWVLARITFGAMLLAIGVMIVRKTVLSAKPLLVMTVFTLYSIFVVAFVMAFAGDLPTLLVPGEGLTDLKLGAEALTAAMFMAGIALYLKAAKATVAWTYPLIASALAVGVFEETSFSLYGSVYDAFSLLGHLFGFASFGLVFLAFFVPRRPSKFAL